jgi:cytochrome c-type biogenesis protein CcmF
VERDARLCVTPEPGCPTTVTVARTRDHLPGADVGCDRPARQVGAELDVDGKVFAPGIQQFPNGTQQIGKPSVRNTARDSVLLTLTDLPGADASVSVKIIVQPLIVWLWIGGGVMAIGSLMAIFPGRRRVGTAPVSR